MSEKNQTRTLTINNQEVKLSPTIVRDYITGGQTLSDAEYAYFVSVCKNKQLNPLLKEIYAIKYSNNSPATFVVSKDVYIRRAATHPDFEGEEKGIYVKNEDGVIESRKGGFYTENEEVVGGWAIVYKKGKKPFEEHINLYEVAGTVKGGNFNSNWANKPATMVMKVALVRAIRAAFPEEFANLSMRDVEDHEKYTPEKDKTPTNGKEKAEREIIDAEIVEQTGEVNETSQVSFDEL